MTCNNIILSQPATGATLNHEIPDDVSARLNFGPEDISGLRIGDAGELVISFAEGGQLNITNFDSVVDNGNLLYLEDGTLIDPTILTSALRSPQDFNNIETAAGGIAAADTIAQGIELAKPQANTVQQVSVQDGQKYVCNFDPSNATVEVRGDKMYLTFADGSQIVINNFEQAQLPEALLIPEQEILTQVEPIEEVLEVAVAETAPEPKVTTQESVAEQVATIEPAAGEVDSIAQNLANIAPAAGEGQNGNSGYGFSSSADSANFDSAFAIGPINETQLNYAAPNLSQETFDFALADDAPVAFSSEVCLDETSFMNGHLVGEGQVDVDFGADGAGSILPNGAFSASGEVGGGQLSSGGVPVVVTQTTNGYVGTANGQTIFTFDLDSATGEYVYTQFDALDHADTSADNEALFLDFGVIVRDADGDAAITAVRIKVLDDAPLIGDDSHTVDETSLSNGVITVDDSVSVDFGQDGKGSVMTAGQFSSEGSQTNGTLSSNGVAVIVTQTANGYVGVAGGVTVFTLDINADTGAYRFQQFANLDHADGNDDNDVITLNFPIKVTDADGDSDPGVIKINVVDDAPEANDDALTVDDGDTVTGNVQNNDSTGQDSQATVTQVMIDGQTYNVPANGTVDVPGQFGTLTIAADGSYTYVAQNGKDGGMDQFKYTLRDGDGDTDTAILKITVEDDETPIDINGVGQTDDTNLADDDMDMITGVINVNYQGDGPGTTTGTGSFGSAGNLTAGNLSSNGVAVAVTFDAATNTYTGVAGGKTVFTMVINSDATFKFTQLAPLDHSNTNSDNEALFLDFGVTATDSDGDTGTGTVRITVLDDGPSITTVAQRVSEDDIGTGAATIMNTIRHDFGEDGAGVIQPNGKVEAKYSTQGSVETLTSGGVAVIIAQTATGYVGTAAGETIFTFTIDPSTGKYTYTQNGPIDHPEDHPIADDVVWLKLGVDIIDNDGDTESAYVVFDIQDDEPKAVDDKVNVADGERAQGNVLTNDDIGFDANGSVTTVTFEGRSYNVPAGGAVTVEGNNGTLVMNSTGQYSYTANGAQSQTINSFHRTGGFGHDGAGEIQEVSGSYNETTEQLNFSFKIEGTQANGFTLVLNDGPNPRGTSGEMAILYFDASNAGTPIISAYGYNGVNGFSSYQDGSNQAGIQAPDRILGSNDADHPFSNISVTTDAHGNQTFSFSLDASEINDHSPLHGAADADWNGVAFDDLAGLWFHPLSGLETSYDAHGNLISLSHDDQSWWDVANVPTTETTINTGTGAGDDLFTYTVVDGDGDTSTADLDICPDGTHVPPVVDVNPIAINGASSVDETNLQDNFIEIDGVVNVDFQGDAAGATSGNGQFNSNGSRLGNTLTSDGQAVQVSFDANSNAYRGVVGNTTIFVMTISEDATYTFRQFQPLDHGNPNSDNEALFLNFGVTASDADGDTGTGFVRVTVLDDGPNARDDFATTTDKESGFASATQGSLIDNDDVSVDANNFVSSVTINGVTTNLPSDGEQVKIDGAFGELTISQFGSFVYRTEVGVEGDDVFTYTLQDVDGDTDTATLTIRNGDVFENVINVDGAGVYNGTADADLFILDAITNGAPTLNDVEVGHDCIDLSALLENVDADELTNAINDFVYVTDSEDGQDTLVFVDVDGQGGEEAQLAVRLTGTNDNTLEDLIENHTIIV